MQQGIQTSTLHVSAARQDRLKMNSSREIMRWSTDRLAEKLGFKVAAWCEVLWAAHRQPFAFMLRCVHINTNTILPQWENTNTVYLVGCSSWCRGSLADSTDSIVLAVPNSCQTGLYVNKTVFPNITKYQIWAFCTSPEQLWSREPSQSGYGTFTGRVLIWITCMSITVDRNVT